uniref:Histamine H3 receptor n=1 Tax=Cyprinus carpio TaxID=7962 RepID=A0A8C2DM96_CYPCA
MWKSGNPHSSNWTGLERENATSLGDVDAFENRRAQYGQFSPSASIFLTVLMTLLVFATVLGNALVILAFVVEKSLRTQGNFFFLNLAIADFLVGGFCIPVYIPYVLTGEWRLGRGLCKLWLVVDYMLCTASVFNIVLISFDRFQSVTKAVSYRCQKGITREAVLKMLCVWLAAFLLYGPAIISWEHIAGGSVVPDGECYAEFYFNWYFLMTASAVEFFTPFISVTYFNLSIYINIRNRCAVREEQPTYIRKGGSTCPQGHGAAGYLLLQRCTVSLRGSSGYTLLMIIRAACHGQCVQHYLYEISFWLLWINSSINPILYPLCHSSFKRAFSKLLCPSKTKIQPQNMDQKY